jgi:hypothetical protein
MKVTLLGAHFFNVLELFGLEADSAPKSLHECTVLTAMAAMAVFSYFVLESKTRGLENRFLIWLFDYNDEAPISCVVQV